MNLVFSITAWTMILLGSLSIFRALRNGFVLISQLHQIPCSQCQYFTHSHFIKCTVHPHAALTEAAINCQDYSS